MAKENLAQHWQVAQEWDMYLRETFRNLDRAQQLLEQKVADAQAKQVKTDAADALLGVQVDGYEGHGQSHNSPYQHSN